jgi:VIT1/CCC1 family predicted Fe2+/Mn2+ transporter
VLIVLTFTLATRAVQTYSGAEQLDGWDSVLQLFVAAAGCAVAWGLIDGAMYVLTCLFERGKERRLYRLIRTAPSQEEGIAILADELDDDLGEIANASERHQVYGALYERLRTSPPIQVGFEKSDFAGGLGTFLVAVAAALPVLVPLLLFPNNASLGLRVSNFVAFAMLFGMGFRWGQYAGGKPWLSGMLLLILGVLMVVIAIPLGG